MLTRRLPLRHVPWLGTRSHAVRAYNQALAWLPQEGRHRVAPSLVEPADARVDAIIARLHALRGAKACDGVCLLEHLLQAATRALAAHAGDDLVTAALLHDAFELSAPTAHGAAAAALLEPYWEPRTTFAVAHHDLLQPYCYLPASVYGAGHNSQSASALTRSHGANACAARAAAARAALAGHPARATLERLMFEFDAPAFVRPRGGATSAALPLDAFVPALRRVLARPVHWYRSTQLEAPALSRALPRGALPALEPQRELKCAVPLLL